MAKNLLFISACTDRATSRTLSLARRLLGEIKLRGDINATELDLFGADIAPLDAEAVVRRNRLIDARQFDDPMFSLAHTFAAADIIVIAAPYWDLSFPSILKVFVESICVNGVTFCYNELGVPQSLCRAQHMVYVTTSGGFIGNANFGYDYLCGLCSLFHIEHTEFLSCEGLDINGADVAAALNAAADKIPAICDSIF